MNSVNTGDLVKSRLLRAPSCGERGRVSDAIDDHVTPRMLRTLTHGPMTKNTFFTNYGVNIKYQMQM